MDVVPRRTFYKSIVLILRVLSRSGYLRSVLFSEGRLSFVCPRRLCFGFDKISGDFPDLGPESGHPQEFLMSLNEGDDGNQF